MRSLQRIYARGRLGHDMGKKLLREILSEYAERDDYVKLPPFEREELSALLGIAERVKHTLVPVNPEPGFLTGLERDLLGDAGHRHTTPPSFWSKYAGPIIFTLATLTSAASLTVILVYISRQRRRAGRLTPS